MLILRYVNFITVVSFVLLFSCVVISFAGCNKEGNADLTDKEKFINQIKLDFYGTHDCDAIEFVADGFAQSVALSASYSIEVEIVDTDIYFNGILYDNFFVSNNFQIPHSEDYLVSINEKVTNGEVNDTIQKIQNCEHSYILETQNTDSISGKIAIYKIDDTYYFVALNTGNQVIRIFYAEFE